MSLFRSTLVALVLLATPALAADQNVADANTTLTPSANETINAAKNALVVKLTKEIDALEATRTTESADIAIATTRCNDDAVAWRGAKYDFDQVGVASALSFDPDYQAAITKVALASSNTAMTAAEESAKNDGASKVWKTKYVAEIDAKIKADQNQIADVTASMQTADSLLAYSIPAARRAPRAFDTHDVHYWRDPRDQAAHNVDTVLPPAFDQCLGRNVQTVPLSDHDAVIEQSRRGNSL